MSPDTFAIKSSSFRAHQLPKLRRDNRPNILLLMTDQQRYDTINAAGFDFMHSPNLDRLVNQGCLYRNAYSPNPICLAARHNLMTGLPARYHRFPDNMHGAVTRSDLPTIPRILSDSGYETRAIGKMHFVPPRRHNGFDKLELMEELPYYREQDEYAMYLRSVGLGHIQHIHGVRHLLYMLPQRSLIPEEHHGTKWVADRSIEFIKTNRGRHPFFLFASWIAPHPPFDVPESFADLYVDADLPLPHRSITPLPALSEESKLLGDLPSEPYVRRMREVYYAAISHVDQQIGRILDALAETGQLDRTLIIFVSDHGEFLGDYGLYQKWHPYDSTARIPFVVRYPHKVAAGSMVDVFVDLNDILPTILDVAELEYEGDITLPGESLFSESKTRDRAWQYLEYSYDSRRWVSIRNDAYKFNYYYGGGFEQLFDMQNDPYETTNLLASPVPPAVAAVKAGLKSTLLSYERRWGLAGYTTDDDFKLGEPYVPHLQRNEAFPRFPAQIMDRVEKAEMNDLFDEVLQAVAREPVVKLHELDIAAWQTRGGFSDEAIEKLLAGQKR
jgi:arylsulfatase A-like enzyme